jgi:hypothetical protein
MGGGGCFMTGIEKVTPIRLIRPIKPCNKRRNKSAPEKLVKPLGLSDEVTVDAKKQIKHIDEKI